MKRKLHISIHLILSLLVIYMGVGVTMVHCMHSGVTMPAEMTQMAKQEQGGCQKSPAGCMTVKVVKLSPASIAHSFHMDFQAMPLAMIEPIQWLLPFIQFTPNVSPQIIPSVPHAPPIEYLHLIRVLII